MDRKPNIVLIGVDTLRADHLSCYGYRHPTSPTIDALAARLNQGTFDARRSSLAIQLYL